MKYVIVVDCGVEVPIIFNDIIDHDSVVGNRKAISAGKVSFPHGKEKTLVSCWGRSTTLNLRSRFEIDEEIIQKTLDNY